MTVIQNISKTVYERLQSRVLWNPGWLLILITTIMLILNRTMLELSLATPVWHPYIPRY